MAKHKQKNSHKPREASAPTYNYPAVSVIIPLYNAEKYIAECLDSILAQTFQNFEVIVVDDCSTDSSPAIVESYAPKFGERLKLTKMPHTSGYASLPRNRGIGLSRGKYIYFFDPDDSITPTALEELYTAAENFDADVVHCEKYYKVPDEFYNNVDYRKNLKPYSWPMGEKIFITQPTLLTDNLEKRVIDFGKKWLQWAAWMQLIRRDFIVDNNIKFVNTYSQDLIFTMCELCCAKNYVVLPNVCYFWRQHEGSKVTEKLDVAKSIHKFVAVLNCGIKYLDDFLNERKIFAGRSDLKYVLFDTLATVVLGNLDQIYFQNPTYKLDEFLRKEFDGNNSAAVAFNFNTMNVYRLQLANARNQLLQLQKFAEQAQQRIARLEAELKSKG